MEGDDGVDEIATAQRSVLWDIMRDRKDSGDRSSSDKAIEAAPDRRRVLAHGAALFMAGCVAGDLGMVSSRAQALTSSINCSTGQGRPEGVVVGAVGDLYAQTDAEGGRTLWRKIRGSNTAWGWALVQGDLEVFNVKDFGAVGDGVADDHAAIQAAVDAAAELARCNRAPSLKPAGTVYFPPGVYLVGKRIRAVPSMDAEIQLGIRFVGPTSPHCYDYLVKPAIIKAAPNFDSESSFPPVILDLTWTHFAAVVDLGIDGSQVPDSRGIELGVGDGRHEKVGWALIERVAIVNAAYGVYASGCSMQMRCCSIAGTGRNRDGSRSAWPGAISGIYMRNSGDSDLEGNYINGFEMCGTGNRVHAGTGIMLDEYCGNTNIRGGKIEWNCKGIVIQRSNGVTITGINFDWNTWTHVAVLPGDSNQVAGHGITIVGNRFLGGGTTKDTEATQIGGCAIQMLAMGENTRCSVAIVGNSIHGAGPDAFDFQSINAGPRTYAISFEGSGWGHGVVVGNDLMAVGTTAGRAPGTSIGVFGRFMVEAVGNLQCVNSDPTNMQTLPIYVDQGGRMQATATGATQGLRSGVAYRGDSDVTLRAGVDKPTQHFATDLSSNRKIVLDSVNATEGCRFRVVRTGLGSGSLVVKRLERVGDVTWEVTVKEIPGNTQAWVDVEHDGVRWILTGHSAL